MYGGNRQGGDRGGSKFGGRSSGGSRFGDRDSHPRTMHKAVCAVCGAPCEVPFRPSGSRPIYCSEHFEPKENPYSSRRSDNRGFDKPRTQDGGNNAQLLGELKSLNVKIDKLLSAFESATSKE